jgi:hypothetical protein
LYVDIQCSNACVTTSVVIDLNTSYIPVELPKVPRASTRPFNDFNPLKREKEFFSQQRESQKDIKKEKKVYG